MSTFRLANRQVLTPALVAALAVLAFVGIAWADKVTLEDGEVVYGNVINNGDPVWVKTEEGETRKIPKSQVKSVKQGINAPAVAGRKTTARKPSAGGTAAAGTPRKKLVTYSSAEARSRSVTTPLAAVAIWQEFIDSKPAADELAQAKVQLDKWQDLADTGAEKIKGKWVGGPEREALVQRAVKLTDEGFKMMKDQTLQAIEKLKEANDVYPNSFRSNFFLGYLMMLQQKDPEATKYLDQALKLKPGSPEALNNLALIRLKKKQFGEAITMLHKAAQGRDDQDIARNFVTAVMIAPRQIRNSQRMKPAIEAARLLAAKHGIGQEQAGFMPILLTDKEAETPDPKDALAGGMSSGTGFVVTEDGLIVTNRHVVEGGKTFLVKLSDEKGTQVSAELVVADDEQDLALLRIKPPEGQKLATLSLSNADNPADGDPCTVLGYPLITQLGASIKVTTGIVSSGKVAAVGPDVLLNAVVNPGNSGGPVLDGQGHVMAVVTIKTIGSATEDTYGGGISAGNVRKFLAKNNIKVKTAAAPAEDAPNLSAKQITAKAKPATVCILSTR